MAWLIVVYLLSLISEAIADYCGDNIFCHSPYKCCEVKKGCCYDSMLHNSKHFRLQVWNMWYFWFLIIFMMMSCFGGCGYYRRRRLAMLARSTSSSPQTVRPTTVLAPTQRRSRSRNHEGRQFNFFAYNGPGVTLPEPNSNLPPAYAEVVNQPGLYPVSKVELPPYPGNDKPEDNNFVFPPDGTTMLPHRETSLPPPYTEFDSSPPPCSQPSLPPPQPQQSDFSSQCVPSQENNAQVPAVPAENTTESTANSSTSNTNL